MVDGGINGLLIPKCVNSTTTTAYPALIANEWVENLNRCSAHLKMHACRTAMDLELNGWCMHVFFCLLFKSHETMPYFIFCKGQRERWRIALNLPMAAVLSINCYFISDMSTQGENTVTIRDYNQGLLTLNNKQYTWYSQLCPSLYVLFCLLLKNVSLGYSHSPCPGQLPPCQARKTLEPQIKRTNLPERVDRQQDYAR